MSVSSFVLDVLPENPIALFQQWLREAEATGVTDPNAMVVSTVDSQGRPSSRVLLLKHVDERGFVFYTNTLSQKGRDLAAHPYAALNFFWHELAHQVRVRGPVVPVSDAEADAYFASRAHGSQVGAWASLQGQPLDERASLETRVETFEARYTEGEVPRPPHWSGYRVKVDEIEFWMGRPFRLHDRLLYRWVADRWEMTRLFP